MAAQQIAMIGLGKMGFNLALNLQQNGLDVFAFDTDEQLRNEIAKQNIITANSVKEICSKFAAQKIIWLMVPSGETVDKVIEEFLPHLHPNDIIIDGGNSFYKDSIRRYNYLKEKEINFLDCGTSGGKEGALNGACTMIGGDENVYASVKNIFDKISVENGSLYVGKPGSGHFVKMIHNGIEYGMMQSIAEGFEVLQKSDYDIDFEKVAKLFNHGSVIRGWLMELTQNAFAKDAQLESIKGVMHSSGEGKWTLETALDMGISTPVIALSVMMRYRSQMDDTFSGKIVAALRNEFGGHAVEKK
ncbi:MAG: decarboxylating 6-phosphogluconate dehydrogenase [Bacteroidota bacterium]|nr:decarboxylating 6-phosphogluconate dehydrogenase [Bacteroidota bacterium]